jgi:hypothetical protein
MIPITVSYFTKHGSENRLGAVGEALVYSGGIILTFTVLGVALAVIFGAAGINQFAASPWINLLIAGIFFAFAFSLLGAYDIGVPSSVLTKLDSVTRTNQSHKFIALLLMGLTFTLTSFTCTAPLVGTVLVAASAGELFYPIVGMLGVFHRIRASFLHTRARAEPDEIASSFGQLDELGKGRNGFSRDRDGSEIHLERRSHLGLGHLHARGRDRRLDRTFGHDRDLPARPVPLFA